MARSRLAEGLQMLDECIELVTSAAELKENEKKLRKRVNELKTYVEEVELEPNFWFLPFPVACHNKLHGSLAKMGDFLVEITILCLEKGEIRSFDTDILI